MCIIFILEGDSQPWNKQGGERTGIFQEIVLKGKESVVKVLQTWLGAENKSVFSQPFILKPNVPFPCKGAGRELDLFIWQIARELHNPRWAIQTAEVRCLGCPFNPQVPLKTSPERPMCWGWEKGGGNRGQMGVCEDFQPPPGSGTWLWAACLTPRDLAPRLWIIFCYGDSKYLFLHIWGIRVCPSLCAPAWEGERRACLLPSLHVLGRGQVLLLTAGCAHVLLGLWYSFNF